jgi:mono/diheme cytochrome c family protein
MLQAMEQQAAAMTAMATMLSQGSANGFVPQKAKSTEPQHVLILRRDCASCHKGADARGKLQLFDASDRWLDLDLATLKKISFRLTTRDAKKRMPPPPAKMNPDDRDTVLEWLAVHEPPTAEPPEPQVQPQAQKTIPPEADPKKEDGPF